MKCTAFPALCRFSPPISRFLLALAVLVLAVPVAVSAADERPKPPKIQRVEKCDSVFKTVPDHPRIGWLWVDVECPAGTMVSGGGCFFSEWSTESASNSPIRNLPGEPQKEGWFCNTHNRAEDHDITVCAIALCIEK